MVLIHLHRGMVKMAVLVVAQVILTVEQSETLARVTPLPHLRRKVILVELLLEMIEAWAVVAVLLLLVVMELAQHKAQVAQALQTHIQALQ